jgi:hypothetical protein
MSGADMLATDHLPKVETITPQEAERLLEANEHNRNLRQAWVDSLAGMMSRGEWTLNGETIKLAEDGTLLDGQHRLAAVVAANVTLETVVVRGLPMAAQDTVDIGRGRRLADVLAIEGFVDAHALAAAVNFLHRYRTQRRLDTSRSTAPTPQQALALIEATPDLPESVRVARRVAKEIGGPLGIFAGLHSVFRDVDRTATDEFFESLETGLQLKRGDPVWHLRRHILRPRRDRHYAQTPYYMAALVVKAFNYRRAGRTVELLAFKSKERFPVVEANPRELVADVS